MLILQILQIKYLSIQIKLIWLILGLIPVEYNNYKFNLLDTPGYFDFSGEVISSIMASDAAVIVIDATTRYSSWNRKIFRINSELFLK